MDTLDPARWQFAITTVYHFFFVPVTISLVALVAGLQTAWYRTGKEKYLRLTKFYGKLFLINIAMGVVTGIVQEFQFGMNWSDYSRFVGDVFGAPLALEGLLAFFLESTFIGLWIFGWDRLPRGIHLACIWIVAGGSLLSAYFILAANSWMQNPVGFRYNAQRGRAEMTDIGSVLTNKVLLVTFPHTISAAFMVGGAFVAGVALWHLIRRPGTDTSAFRTALRLGAVTVIIAGVGVALSGDQQGKVMTQVQPMKMAAAEALYQTEKPASLSIFTIGTLDGSREIFSVKVPYVLSFLATGSFTGEVKGINELQASYEK
ncbi:MAG TPA: cytochrome ubiquinol oxidase subunit I, partial [Kribbella sp.]